MIKKYSDNNLNFARLCLMLFCAIFVYFASMLFINQNESASASEWKNHCSSLDSVDKKQIGGTTYRIVDTPEKLAYFTTTTTSYNIMVVKNLDMSAYQWTPICKTSTFTGIFDGGGCEISGLTMSNTYRDKYVTGLFGNIGNGAKIRNVVLKNVKILSLDKNADFTGAIAGKVESGSATIENCSVSGEITVSTTYSSDFAVGGILGYSGSSQSVNITGCQNNINIKVKKSSNSDLEVGGIVGEVLTSSSKINTCVNYGQIQGVDYDAYQKRIFAGGIVGYCTSSISECANYGDVLSGSDYSQVQTHGLWNWECDWVETAYSGGIVGYCMSSVRDCYNRAKIVANAKDFRIKTQSKTSGIAKSDLEIHDHNHFQYMGTGSDNAYFTCSEVTTSSFNKMGYAGGISGYAKSVSNSYSIGNCVGGYSSERTSMSLSFKWVNHWNAIAVGDRPSITYTVIMNYNRPQANGISGEITSISNCHYNGEFYNNYYDSETFAKQSSKDAYYKIFHNGAEYIHEYCSHTTNHSHDQFDSNPKMKVSVSYYHNNDSNGQNICKYSLNLTFDGCFGEASNLNSVNKNPINFSCTEYSNKGLSKTTSQLSSSSFYSTLGKDNWAYDSKINDGYPYIKSLYHQN